MTDAQRSKYASQKGRKETVPGYKCELERIHFTLPTSEAFKLVDPINFRFGDLTRKAIAEAMKSDRPEDVKLVGSPEWVYEVLKRRADFKDLATAIQDTGCTRDPVQYRINEKGQYVSVDGTRRTMCYYYLNEMGVPGFDFIPAVVYDPATANKRQIALMVAALHISDKAEWEKYNQACAAKEMLDMGIKIDVVAKQLKRQKKALLRWIKALELHQKSEDEHGIYDANKFIHWSRFVKSELYQDMLKQNQNGRIWKFISYAITHGMMNWSGAYQPSDLKRIYDNPQLRVELEAGGGGLKVIIRALEAERWKGALGKLAKAIEQIPSMCAVASDQLDEFRDNEEARAKLVADLVLGSSAMKSLAAKLAAIGAYSCAA